MTDQARPISDDVTTLMERLEIREKVLTERIAAQSAELLRVKTTLASLHNLRNGEAGGNNAPLSTRNVARRYLETMESGAVITTDKVLAFAETVNWRTVAIDRRNAVATTLSHLHELGEIEKSAHGIYRKP